MQTSGIKHHCNMRIYRAQVADAVRNENQPGYGNHIMGRPYNIFDILILIEQDLLIELYDIYFSFITKKLSLLNFKKSLIPKNIFKTCNTRKFLFSLPYKM